MFLCIVYMVKDGFDEIFTADRQLNRIEHCNTCMVSFDKIEFRGINTETTQEHP